MKIHGNILLRNDRFHYELHRENYNIDTHIHHFVEICVLIEGEMKITVNGITETAKTGQCVLLLPFQEHSYHSKTENVFAIYAFSPSIISEFMKKNEGMVGERAVFDASELTLEMLKKKLITDRDFSVYNIKGCLYLLLDDYTKQVSFVSGFTGGTVLNKLISYLSKNYNKPCPLPETARAIGYSPKYVSSCLQESFGINYCSLLNGIRVEHSKYALTETDTSVLEVSLECGFNDVRSFQRNFKKIVGTTPLEYRNTTKNTTNIQLTSHIFPKSYFGE